MKLSGIDLNLLVALDALLAERNVTRAGERVGLTQPTMSNALSRLRHLFNDPLLVKVGRNLELTQRARGLVAPVRSALALIEVAITHPPSFDPKTAERSFTIVTSDYGSLVLLQPVMARLAREAPRVGLQVLNIAPHAVQRLDRGEADFVIQPAELGGSHETRELLWSDEWVCVVAEDHPEAKRGLDRALFVELPHLGFMNEEGGRSIADTHLLDTGVLRRIDVTVPSFVTIPLMLAGTRLVAMVLRRLAEHFREHAAIRIFPIPFDLPPLDETLFWSTRHEGDLGHDWLRSVLREEAAALAETKRARKPRHK
jgi:LysR family transcriptional regulator, nod-box dependent transcriptional activator